MSAAIEGAGLTPTLIRAAGVILDDYLGLRPEETLVVTADCSTDRALTQALLMLRGAVNPKTGVFLIPPLPFQGALADPFVSEPLAQAVKAADAWIDLTFPYLAGARAHAEAMEGGKTRYLLLADMSAGGAERLFGRIPLDLLFELQGALDGVITAASGKDARITTPSGTDVRFKIGRPQTRKLRVSNRPGSYTPPGSAVIYPEPDTVKGRFVVEAAFHEFHTRLAGPMTLEVDGQIRAISGPVSDCRVMDRALRRAGGGEYGRIIHLSHGFHPLARFTGKSFIEDIRTVGNDAVGLGVPWWEPGGGENHPDAVATMQTLWIEGEKVVADGQLAYPPDLVRLERELHKSL